MPVNQPNNIEIDADIIDCQFPTMLAGQIICSVGTGLLIMIGTTTPIVAWAAFMVVPGLETVCVRTYLILRYNLSLKSKTIVPTP